MPLNSYFVLKDISIVEVEKILLSPMLFIYVVVFRW
jgi:hypothetical protein